MPKKKKFIDKKNAVTFHLVHRSQKDPLVADETAPQRVLVPAANPQAAKIEKKATADDNKRKEELQKYGIYFDDDYDYLQHLRDVNRLQVEWQPIENANSTRDRNDAKIKLPSSVFASNVEENVGLLNRAAPVRGPQLDLDPDVVAALDDDFDFTNPENQLEENFIELVNAENDDKNFDKEYDPDVMAALDDNFDFTNPENQLADNFMELANAETDDEDSDREHEYELDECDKSDAFSDDNMNLSDEEADKVGSLNGSRHMFEEEETKSRFTQYSMSSSVMRRNEQLTLLDDKFEKMYATYDENEIGALDCDEIEGYVEHDADRILQYAKEFEKKKIEDIDNVTELMKDRLKVLENIQENSENEDDLEDLVVDARGRNKWDCESILSTYSNIYNHPKLIREPPKHPKKIEIDAKTGIPKNVLGKSGKLTAAALSQLEWENNTRNSAQSVAESRKSTLSILSIRPKGETCEERKERKKLLKDYRKERRIERKANTEAFKEEKKRQEKIRLNIRRTQGDHIL